MRALQRWLRRRAGLLYLSLPFLLAVNKAEIITGRIKPCCENSVTVFPADAGDPGKTGPSNSAFMAHFAALFQFAMQSGNGASRLVNVPAAAPRDQTEAAYDMPIQLARGGAWDGAAHSSSRALSVS